MQYSALLIVRRFPDLVYLIASKAYHISDIPSHHKQHMSYVTTAIDHISNNDRNNINAYTMIRQ